MISVCCRIEMYMTKSPNLQSSLEAMTFSHPDVSLSVCLLQVIEVILPMLCNYLSYWWEKGPENSPAGAQCCTMVTSEHLSLILGNILKILNSNLGIDDAPWMKRIAGKAQGSVGIKRI